MTNKVELLLIEDNLNIEFLVDLLQMVTAEGYAVMVTDAPWNYLQSTGENSAVGRNVRLSSISIIQQRGGRSGE